MPESKLNRLNTYAMRMIDHATPAELRLWKALLYHRADFEFQLPFTDFAHAYIADFMIRCESTRLIVELDGAQHGLPEARRYDATRDAWFTANGYTVLRIPNSRVMCSLEAVLDQIGQHKPLRRNQQAERAHEKRERWLRIKKVKLRRYQRAKAAPIETYWGTPR